MIQITLNIPALERYCDLLEKQGGSLQLSGGSAATPPAEKTGGKAKAEKPAPAPAKEETPEAPAHTVETITEKARELISLSSPATLRKLLDEVIGKNVKIGEAKEKDFPKLAAAIEKALSEHKDSGL